MLREAITFAAGVAVGVAIRSLTAPDPGATPAETGEQADDYPDDAPVLDGEELDPRVHGEFRGPDNPAPGTEAWYDARAEEVAEEFPMAANYFADGDDAKLDTLVGAFKKMHDDGFNEEQAEAAFERVLREGDDG